MRVKKTINEKTNLLYSFGGGVATGLFGKRVVDFDNMISNKLGYGLFGSLGLEHDLNNYLGFYVKTIAKFYDIHASDVKQNSSNDSFPATKAWVAMVETGITF